MGHLKYIIFTRLRIINQTHRQSCRFCVLLLSSVNLMNFLSKLWSR